MDLDLDLDLDSGQAKIKHNSFRFHYIWDTTKVCVTYPRTETFLLPKTLGLQLSGQIGFGVMPIRAGGLWDGGALSDL